MAHKEVVSLSFLGEGEAMNVIGNEEEVRFKLELPFVESFEAETTSEYIANKAGLGNQTVF